MKFKFCVCLNNGSEYVVEAHDEKEAYSMATEQEIESLRKEFEYRQKHGNYYAFKVDQAPIVPAAIGPNEKSSVIVPWRLSC